jgi:hypothetical protein
MRGKKEAVEARAIVVLHDKPRFFVIYHAARDVPDFAFVVRPWLEAIIGNPRPHMVDYQPQDGTAMVPQPICCCCHTLEEARAGLLPMNLTNMGKHGVADDVIYEWWL